MLSPRSRSARSQHPVQIDVAGQAQIILPREAKKEPVDSQPGYTYSANVFGATAFST